MNSEIIKGRLRSLGYVGKTLNGRTVKKVLENARKEKVS
jgi:hypothetical protein